MTLPEWWPDWTGESCIIVASGPSVSGVHLEPAKSFARFIAVNTSWRLAPWSDILYACDHAWWASAKGCPEFKGLKLSIDKRATILPEWDIKLVGCTKARDLSILDRSNTVGWGGNSGFHALQLAVQFGCKKVLLVGFDMTVANGVHWHGEHESGLHNPDEGNVARWRRATDAAAGPIKARGVTVINCSAGSALTGYEKMDFAEAVQILADTFTANGARFVAADDMIVRWCRTSKASFEPETTAWMFDAMAQGDGAFVDVGASTGWYSIPMALKGYKVTAFEPHPSVYERLLKNTVLNGVEIEARNVAVSDKAGPTAMWINPAVPLTSGGSIEAATCKSPREITVETTRLDDCGLAPRLMKVDVEGHEMSVLSGAEETIKRYRPHLVLEANTDVHRYSLSRWLRERGYKFKFVDERNMLCTPE